MLFSEQVKTEIEGTGYRNEDEYTTADNSNFYYVDDEMPPAVGIIAGDEPMQEDTPIAEPQPEPVADESVDINFWLQNVDGAEAAGPSRANGDAPKSTWESENDQNDDNDDYTYDRADPGPSEGSYHSGDTDEYEMDHRPWLDRAAIKRDIQALYSISGFYNPSLGTYRYRVVDRLGEGTFSSVYLAKDLLHNVHDNTYWTGEENTDQVDELYQPSEVKVALKKILVTSSPARVENEISILENLRGCRHVSPMVSAFRDEDQIIIVLPFHQSDDFRYFYKLMDPPKIRQYMTCLLRSLKDIHARGIIHRDVKPANFLFDYEQGHGVLVDFGLAERYQPPKRASCQHEPATRENLHGVRTRTSETDAVEQAVYNARKRGKAGEGRVGFRQEDSRPAVKTNRAGTRGFRAPEVLLKCPDQTVAIDVWSAGIILLSLMTHKFPVFNSNDDVEALMEIAAIFGRGAMERCAMLHNRTIITNVPSVDDPPESLSTMILRLNPHLYTPHQPHPTPDQAAEHIANVDAMLDLVTRLLHMDPTRRLTASAALRHRFINADDSPDELIDPTEGKCGHLHEWTAEGQRELTPWDSC